MAKVIGFAQVEAIFTNTAWNSWIFGNIVKKKNINRSLYSYNSAAFRPKRGYKKKFQCESNGVG